MARLQNQVSRITNMQILYFSSDTIFCFGRIIVLYSESKSCLLCTISSRHRRETLFISIVYPRRDDGIRLVVLWFTLHDSTGHGSATPQKYIAISTTIVWECLLRRGLFWMFLSARVLCSGTDSPSITFLLRQVSNFRFVVKFGTSPSTHCNLKYFRKICIKEQKRRPCFLTSVLWTLTLLGSCFSLVNTSCVDWFDYFFVPYVV